MAALINYRRAGSVSSPRGADGRGRGRNPETPGRASGPSRDHRAQNPRERFCQAVRGSPEQWDVGRGPGRGQQGHPLSLAGWPWAGPRPLVRGVTPHRWRASLRGRPRMRWRWAPPCTSSLSAGSFRASRTARHAGAREKAPSPTGLCSPDADALLRPIWSPCGGPGLGPPPPRGITSHLLLGSVSEG